MRLSLRALVPCLALVVAAMSVVTLAVSQAIAGGTLITGSAVGGISIDTSGAVTHPEQGELAKLQKIWNEALEQVPGEMDAEVELRFISLRKLDEQIADYRSKLLPLPQEVHCLAGLTAIKYVLVYPEQNDVVIAGPAEGWQVDALGNIVGKKSGRPILMLDDLMAALRSGRSSANGGISCSINPSPEGASRLQQFTARQRTIGNPAQTMAQMENVMGPQVVSVTGVPKTSHFARVLVAADFRMKRIAMGFSPAPVEGLPSYLAMVKSSGSSKQNMLPRWWLAPKYEPLKRDEAGLAWEMSGREIRCETEADFLTAEGEIRRGGRAGAVAQKWANMMSDKFPELARKDSSFAHLENIMDLTVVAALLEKEQLLSKAGVQLPRLMKDELLEQYNAPQSVPSQASFVRHGRNWLIAISGGVQIEPWQIVQKSTTSASLAKVRNAAGAQDSWWWD